jgi:serine/threonine protein kinase
MLGSKTSARYLQGVDKYVFLEVLGEGAFSIVRKARLADDETALFACKILPKTRLAENGAFQRFQSSLQVLEQMQHPNICRLIETRKDGLFYYIFLEYCPGGTLRSYISDRKRLSANESRKFMGQICSAVSFIHNAGACHRDLKPENILLDANRDCKITDFDMADFVASSALSKLRVGTTGYSSPERLSGAPYNPQKNDIWAVGVCFYAMMSGRLPWDTSNEKQMANQIKRGNFEIPAALGPGFVRIVKGLLNPDPAQRMSLEHVLADEWITTGALRRPSTGGDN